MSDQPNLEPSADGPGATAGFEPVPTAPVPAGQRHRASRFALVGGSLLLGAAAIAAAVAGPSLAGSGSQGFATLAASTGIQLADLTGGTGFGPGGHGGHGDRMGDRGMHGPLAGANEIGAAATAIGVSEADLLAALRDGKTIASVASAKGVSVSTVVAAMVKAETAELDAAVTAGRLSQAQADALKATLTQRFTDVVNGTFTGPDGAPGMGPGGRGHGDRMGGMGMRGPGGLHADDLAAAAKALGVTESALTADLQAGKTIADVATAKGVALQKVIDAIVASDRTEIATALKAGRITQAQADRMLANLTAHVTAEVNGTVDDFGGHGFGPGCDDSTGTSSGTSGSSTSTL